MRTRKFPRIKGEKLTKEEKRILSLFLDKVEWREYYPMKHISGAYASASVYNYDETHVFIEVEWGIEDYDYTEAYKNDFKIPRSEISIELYKK